MDNNQPVFIIAEAGVNHNGDLGLALELIDAAAEAGADAIKFQTFRASDLVSKHAMKAGYQALNTGAGTQLEMLSQLELSEKDHVCLINHCRERGIKFLSTPFDLKSLALLAETFDLDIIKLGSGELTNAPLILAAAQTGKNIILSTGMASLDEIADALGVLAYGYSEGSASPCRESFAKLFADPRSYDFLKEKVTLLHCTTEYPAPIEEVNLRAMNGIASRFGLKVGYSDHTQGITIPVAAVALGACVIEKHFTLDVNLPGPDHKASLTPEELTQLVQNVRQTELSLGNGTKNTTEAEEKNKSIVRKSLVAKTNIPIGAKFSSENISVKRPGTGRSPFEYWDIMGKISDRSYNKDDLID